MRILIIIFFILYGNAFAAKVELHRPYELDSVEFSILKNQLYSCVDENKIYDEDLKGIEVQTFFAISQMRNVYYPEILNPGDIIVTFGNEGLTTSNSTEKKAENIILDVFDNPDCKKLILPINRYDTPRELIFNFNFEEIQSFYNKKQSTSIIVVDLPGMKCAGDSYDGKLINGLAFCKEAFGNWYVQMNDSFISGVGLKEYENGEKVLANFYDKKFDGWQLIEENNVITIQRNVIEWGEGSVNLNFNNFLGDDYLQFYLYLDDIYYLLTLNYDMGEILSGSSEEYYFDTDSNQYVIRDDSFAMHYYDNSKVNSLIDIITPESFENATLGKVNSEGSFSGPVIDIINSDMNYFYVDEYGNWDPIPTKDFQNSYEEVFQNQLDFIGYYHTDIKIFWDKVTYFLKSASKIGLNINPTIEELSLSDKNIEQIKQHYSEYISKLN